jgi:Cof subfamily protein (haloacid dehalogenase superfamily)
LVACDATVLAAMKLFATDLDGTLVDQRDGIHPRDLAAITRARAQGVIVTIATGRLTSRTHPIARALGLDAPLVCADGGVLACSTTERVLQRRPLLDSLVERALDVLNTHGLSSFVFTHEAIHSCERGRAYHEYVRGWSHAITAHADVRSATASWLDTDTAIMVAGIGQPAIVERALSDLAELRDQIEVFAFDIGAARVVRLMAKGVTKGAGLMALAKQLGIAAEHVAVAGDWYNDLSMFALAGHSYAMPHAPLEVKAAASHVLAADAPQRGAIADALEHWLAG